MDQLDVSQYVSGGYFLAKYAARPECMSAELLPTRILSASSCITDIPDAWAVTWASYTDSERRKEAAKFGVTPEVLPQMLDWVTSRLESKEVGWPVVFYTVDMALDFARRFLHISEDLALVGIGLRQEDASDWLVEEEPRESEGTPGIYEALSMGHALESGGEVIGFEVLGYDMGSFHSWLCNGLEVDCYRAFNICPNRKGLIRNLEEAIEVAEYASREEVGAEPVLWQPWLVAQYPIE